MVGVLRKLAVACQKDNDTIVARCSETVATMLQAVVSKNVALMREIAFICWSRDISSPAFLLTGSRCSDGRRRLVASWPEPGRQRSQWTSS